MPKKVIKPKKVTKKKNNNNQKKRKQNKAGGGEVKQPSETTIKRVLDWLKTSQSKVPKPRGQTTDTAIRAKIRADYDKRQEKITRRMEEEAKRFGHP